METRHPAHCPEGTWFRDRAPFRGAMTRNPHGPTAGNQGSQSTGSNPTVFTDRNGSRTPNRRATSAIAYFQKEPFGRSFWQSGSPSPCYQEVLASTAQKAPRKTCLLCSSRPLTGGLGRAHRPAPFPREHQRSRRSASVPRCPGGESPAQEGADQKLRGTGSGPRRTAGPG